MSQFTLTAAPIIHRFDRVRNELLEQVGQLHRMSGHDCRIVRGCPLHHDACTEQIGSGELEDIGQYFIEIDRLHRFDTLVRDAGAQRLQHLAALVHRFFQCAGCG